MNTSSNNFNHTSNGYHNGNTPNKLYIETPLLESTVLSKGEQRVFLKLENTQPSGSFKIRGISNLIKKELRKGCIHLVASSGGNAGMSAAYTARILDIPITIFVPTSTPSFMVEKIRSEGAEVVVHGSMWDEANKEAMKMAEKDGYALIPPFDHPDIWEGNSTCVDELKTDLEKNGCTSPDLVVLSVGGGGLFCGIVQGMERNGWEDVPILAMETEGAGSLYASVQAGQLVTLKRISSVAKTLGAATVAKQTFAYYQSRYCVSEVVSDKQSVDACIRFADDHRMLLETSCGASLAALYSGIIQKLQESEKLPNDIKNIVVIICGGNAINLQELERLKKMFDL